MYKRIGYYVPLTINMERRQDNTMNGRDGRHKQCSGLTDSSYPFLFSSNYTDDDEDVVSSVLN